ncbi:MAG: translation elongation factor 4 [Elusimicrobiota bacterium]
MLNKLRNFCIIAHIDHGKSTLADRLLEYTGLMTPQNNVAQIMDNMSLERERGITIKAKTARLKYKADNGEEYILNLIDTPGHVDFSYEVARSLDASEGCLLIVDASQGVEAQTLVNAQLAMEYNIAIIPVINKIDLPQSNVERTEQDILESLEILEKPLHVSAKEGKGIHELLEAIVKQIPAPQGDPDKPLKALIFDSFYDPYRGVVIYLKIVDGVMKPNQKIVLESSGMAYEVQEIGYLQLSMIKSNELTPGEVGYCVANIKDIHLVKIGDTIMEKDAPVEPIKSKFKSAKPFVFCGFYPITLSDLPVLQAALEKLHLTDWSFYYQPENSSALGMGFRCGFLGLLHMDIVKQRLEREFGLDVLVTSPNVIYRVIKKNNEAVEIDNPAKYPNLSDIISVEEPYVAITVVVPSEFVSVVMELIKDRRGEYQDMKYINAQRVIIKCVMPLAEMVVNFYDKLKSVSKGYASFDYEQIGYKPGQLVKLEILVNREVIDGLAYVVHRESSYHKARKLITKLKEIIPRQMFEIALQIQVNNKIIARENIPAMRKDVISKCYGGDITRKRKLLEKQKEGKKRLRQFGRVEVPVEAFLAAMRLEEE